MWWSRVLEDPSSVYPKTIAAMEAIDHLLLFPALLKSRCSTESSSSKDTKLAAPNSRSCMPAKSLALHFFCRSRSRSAMRAALGALCGFVEGYTEAKFVAPMPLLADDKFYMDMVAMADAKSELHQYWKLWGLEDASLIGNFAMLSSNVENNPKRDFVTDKFSRGRGTCKLLFDHCCCAIAPLPSNCVWVDLVFSQMKNAQNSNESEESLDHVLV
jgi:hypothetical protein